MEQVIVKLFENSLVGGAFVFLLWYVTTNFDKALRENTLELKNITTVLTNMNVRIEKIEDRMNDVEDGIKRR